MVTKPLPIWERWFKENKEQALQVYYVLIILVNIFIALGLVLFILMLLYK